MSTSTAHRLIHIAGLPINVYSSPSSPLNPTTPRRISIFFFLHGRESCAEALRPYVEQIFERVEVNKRDHRGGTPRELILVTFDQRNHGHRFVDPSSIGTWDEGNPNHAVDMYAMFVGTSKDITYLIDFLPSYLFPTTPLSPSTLSIDWCVGGISLGGHATWWSLRHEPRISLGISIIGCPSYTHLITSRAHTSTPPIPLTPPYFPPSFVAYLEGSDAGCVGWSKGKGVDGEGEWEVPESWRVSMSEEGEETAHVTEDRNRDEEGKINQIKTKTKGKTNPYIGRKILILAGGDDTLVPWVSCREVVEGLDVGGGVSALSATSGGSDGGRTVGGEGRVRAGEGRANGDKSGGVKKTIVYPGIAHQVTDEMIRETADFIWEWSLTRGV